MLPSAPRPTYRCSKEIWDAHVTHYTGQIGGFLKRVSQLCGQFFKCLQLVEGNLRQLDKSIRRDDCGTIRIFWQFQLERFVVLFALFCSIVETSNVSPQKRHSQSQLKPSYKVTIFCADKGNLLKMTTVTPSQTKLQMLHMGNKFASVYKYVCKYVCVCVCAAFPWNAIEIRDNIMPGRGGWLGDWSRHHLPQCTKNSNLPKNVSQHCFCAGPRLENELQTGQTTPYNNNNTSKTKTKMATCQV